MKKTCVIQLQHSDYEGDRDWIGAYVSAPDDYSHKLSKAMIFHSKSAARKFITNDGEIVVEVK